MIKGIGTASNKAHQSIAAPEVEPNPSRWRVPAFIAIGIGAGLGSLVTAIPRAYSYAANKPLHDRLEKAQAATLAQSLKIVLQGPERGRTSPSPIRPSVQALKIDLVKQGGLKAPSEKEQADYLAQGAVRIRYTIEKMQRGEFPRGGVQSLRSDLAALMNNPLYRKLKNADSAAINFLQYVAVKLIAVDANSVLFDFGKEFLGRSEKEKFSPQELADGMSAYLKRRGFSIDHGRLFYSAAHPNKAERSLMSVLDPLGYDASVGNPTFSAHSFELGKKKMNFYYGPGPTGNPIFEHGVLPAYRKFGVFELRFNFQNTRDKAEALRVRDMVRIADANSDVLKHAVLGFDTKMDMTKFDSVDSFFDAYIAFVKDGLREIRAKDVDNGIYISQEMLSIDQVDNALAKAREFCRVVSQNNSHWKQAMSQGLHGKESMGKTMKLIADTCLCLSMLYRSFNEIPPEMAEKALDERLDRDLTAFRTSGACKQDIDRGVVGNIALRLFFRWASDASPLTNREACEIAGAVIGRAKIAEDRKIMKERYEVLDDFLRFVGSAPRGVAQAHDLLGGYRSSVSPGISQI